MARGIHHALRTRLYVLTRGHRIWQVVADSAFVSFAWWLAFYVRFDNGTPAFYERAMLSTIGGGESSGVIVKASGATPIEPSGLTTTTV